MTACFIRKILKRPAAFVAEAGDDGAHSTSKGFCCFVCRIIR